MLREGLDAWHSGQGWAALAVLGSVIAISAVACAALMLRMETSAATIPIAGISHRIGAIIAAGDSNPSTSAATAQPLKPRYSTTSDSTCADK
jgi:drug/metabolite transporter (DMT)-like permease